MGMYTELIIAVTVPKTADVSTIAIVRHLFSARIMPTWAEQDHPFFSAPRWDRIGSGGSAYHLGVTTSSMETTPWDTLGFSCVCSLKNYGSEIQLFLDWLETIPGAEWKAMYRYEGTDKMTISVREDGKRIDQDILL